MNPTLDKFAHWIGACVFAVVLYFIGSALITQFEGKHLLGNQIAVTAPQPANGATKALQDVAQALKDKALADALAGRANDLSLSQATIANALTKATGINSQLAGALATGLTKPSPKQEVIQVGTTSQSRLVAPPTALSDDQIEASMKKVLAQTKLEEDVHTNVTVKWEDKPFSPIFAAYQHDGATGVGYTFHKAPLLNLDALLTVPTGAHPGVMLGAGLEHVFRGTSAGIGIDAGYNFGSRRVQYGLFAAIHN